MSENFPTFISGTPVDNSLIGTEEVPIIVSGVTKNTTAQDIANLAPGGGGSGIPSYKLTFPIDIVPGSPTSWDDEFAGSSLNSKWTQTNYNTTPSTYIVSNGLLQVRQTNTVTASSRLLNGITQAVPSGNWEFTTCAIANNAVSLNYSVPTSIGVTGGLGATDNVIQLGEVFGNGGALGVGVYLSSLSVYSVSPGVLATGTRRLYFRVCCDGTELVFSYSRDGMYFVLIYQGAPGFTPAYIGLLGDCQDNLFSCSGTYNWFRRTA